MAIEYLKSGISENLRSEEDQKVRTTVEEILASIKKDGDVAIKKLSEKFDNYSPSKFQLSEQEIDYAMSQVSKNDRDDIEYAQKQIRRFAEAQRASMHDIEIETEPGIVLSLIHI